MSDKPLEMRDVRPLIPKIESWTHDDRESISDWCQERLDCADDWYRFVMILAIMCGESVRDMLRIRPRRKTRTALQVSEGAPASVQACAQLVSAAIAHDLPMVSALALALVKTADETRDVSNVNDVVVHLLSQLSMLLQEIHRPRRWWK